MFTYLPRQLSGLQKILYYLPEIDINTLFNFVSQDEVDAENIVRTESLHLVFPVKRFTCCVDTYEPVCIGLFRIPVEYGIKYVTVDFFELVTFCYIYKVVAYIWNIRVVLQTFDVAEVIPHRQLYLLHALYLCAAVPAGLPAK